MQPYLPLSKLPAWQGTPPAVFENIPSGKEFGKAPSEKIWGTGLSASAFMTNVADKANRVANEDLYTTIGTSTTVYGEPRMYGASLRFQF